MQMLDERGHDLAQAWVLRAVHRRKRVGGHVVQSPDDHRHPPSFCEALPRTDASREGRTTTFDTGRLLRANGGHSPTVCPRGSNRLKAVGTRTHPRRMRPSTSITDPVTNLAAKQGPTSAASLDRKS